MTLPAARKLFERHREWAIRIAGSAIRRIGPQADREELQQVAQVATWERALKFDPRRWTVKPRGDPFQLYAYPWVYGSCLMAGYRAEGGRIKAPSGTAYVRPEQLDTWDGTRLDGSGGIRHKGEWLAKPPNQVEIETAVDGASLRRRIALLINDLPKRERWLVAEHYLGGASLSAIAESLHTSPSSVSRIHAEALRLLRLAAKQRGMKVEEWL